MFNEYQREYMEFIETIPAESRCYCGWYKLGECPHCPPGKTCADKLRDRGNAVPSAVCACNDSSNHHSHSNHGNTDSG